MTNKFTFFLILIALMGSVLLAAGRSEESTAGGTFTELKLLGESGVFDLSIDGTPNRLEEILGVPVIAEMLPPEEAGTQKLLLDLASGVPYDLVLAEPGNFARALAGGAVLDITDLLEEYGQNIIDAAAESSWGTVRVDGRVFGIPRVSEQTGGVVEGILIRNDILKSVNKTVPSTPEELLDVARALKTAYPQMYPLTTSPDQGSVLGYWLPFVPIASAFGISTEWVESDSKLLPSIKLEGMREYLQFLNRLYVEGLIDPEFPAHNRETRNQRFISGSSAMSKVGWWDGNGIAPALRDSGITVDLVYMPPLKNESGDQVVEQISAVSTIGFIPKTAPNPQAVIQWVNEFLDTDTFTQIYLGERGVTYTESNGDYSPIQPAFNDILANAYWFIPASIYRDNLSQRMWGARLKKSDDLVWGWENLQAISQQHSIEDPTAYAPLFEDVVKYRESLRVLVKNAMIEFIVNGFNNSDYDAFVAEWEAEGGATIESNLNDWWASSK